MSARLSLYIHIPFCRRKCRYCSFISCQDRESDIPLYIEALKAELVRRARNETLGSIYIGGGTPSLLSAGQIADILSTVGAHYRIEAAAEITLEANPGTVDIRYLKDIRPAGINRLSLGLQSLDDNELSLLGRIHNSQQARLAVKTARDSGFGNLNIDLIYGLPGQTLSRWQNTLEEVIGLEPGHLSLYALTVEAGTPMAKAIEEKSLPPVDPDLAADQYELSEDVLADYGYRHYEISNWAKEGQECYHNTVYWQGLPYLGAGVAAHSYMDGRRFANTNNLDKYLDAFHNKQGPVLESDEEIGPALRLAEAVILGLRMCKGVCPDDISDRFGVDLWQHYAWQIGELVSSGLLEYNSRYIRLTRRGRLLSNEVFWRFLPD